jgi:hypothetical protein
MNTQKQAVTKEEQLQASHKHAKHLATMHLASKNAEGAAKAFEGLPPLVALEFFYSFALHHRHKNKPADAIVAIDAADLIARKEQGKLRNEIKNTKRPLRSSRLYPAHVFED